MAATGNPERRGGKMSNYKPVCQCKFLKLRNQIKKWETGGCYQPIGLDCTKGGACAGVKLCDWIECSNWKKKKAVEK